MVDPMLYIARFAAKLEFEDKAQDVIRDALRLVARMDRDWIVRGRRPSGVCGACIYIAARMHGFRRTARELVRVMKVCDGTIRKRLLDFRNTPSSNLTVEDFQTLMLEECADPPSFRHSSKKKPAARTLTAAPSTPSAPAAIEATSAADAPLTLSPPAIPLDDGRGVAVGPSTSVAPAPGRATVASAFAGGAGAKRGRGFEEDRFPVPGKRRRFEDDEGFDDDDDEDDAATLAMMEDEDEEEAAAAMLMMGEEDEDEGFGVGPSQGVSTQGTLVDGGKGKGRADGEEMFGDEEEEEGALRALLHSDELQRLAENEGVDLGGEDDDLRDLDDDYEVQNVQLTPEEVEIKTLYWNEENADWIMKHAAKLRAQEAAGGPPKPRRPRKKKDGSGGGGSASAVLPQQAAASAQEAAQAVVSSKKQLSRKLNYDIVNSLFAEGAEATKTMGAGGGGGMPAQGSVTGFGSSVPFS
ncbi:transcription factor TFIIIB subunit brf1 [Phlyctochytrium bullatum]|nr:transcription factor TFIIIB subunit brf1 [Phlyctochytrium bullatum]